MKTWNRDEVISELAPRLWDYLTSHTRHIDSYLDIDDLLGLDAGSIQRLAAIKLLDRNRIMPMLTMAEAHLRGLPSSVRRETEDTQAGIRGRVDWPATQRLRMTTGDPLIIRASVVERAYDTWTARILRFALEGVVVLAGIVDLSGAGELAVAIAEMREMSLRLQRHAKVLQARHCATIPADQLERFRSRTHLAEVADFVDQYQCIISMSNTADLKSLIGRSVLVPLSDDKLYELLVGFKLIDAFLTLGFTEEVDTIRGLRASPFSRMTSPEGSHIRVWKETSVFDLDEAVDSESLFTQTLVLAGTPRSSLRPDYVVEIPGRPCLIVEVKHTLTTGKTRDRDGIRDALAYLKDTEHTAQQFIGTRALVVAFGTTATPNATAQIMVTSEDDVSTAIELVISRAPRAKHALAH